MAGADSNGCNCGSGGGASRLGTIGTGTAGQGNNGGTGVDSRWGGGASAVGNNAATNQAGNGGNGTSSSINWSSVCYAGGGENQTGGDGGSGVVIIKSFNNSSFVINEFGNVGIGTTTPGAELNIIGALCVDDTTPTCANASRTAGTIYAVSTSITGIDAAEQYPTKDASLEVGDVVMLDAANPVFVSKSLSAGTLLGVVSTQPGVELGGYWIERFLGEKKVPVTFAGRVPVKVSTEAGPIHIGDRITSSSLPGIGMKATSSGMTIGIALENFDGEHATVTMLPNGSQIKTGNVLVFVNLGYHNLDQTALALAQYSQYASSTASSSIPTFALRSDGSIKDGMFLDMQGGDVVNVRSLVSANGSWEIGEDGAIRAIKIITNEIVADNIKARLVEAEQIKAKEVEASGFRVFRSANANETTVGEGRILRGETETTIYSSKVASTSKIFVSFTGNLAGRSWFIAQKSDSSGSTTPGFFMVRISAPLPDDVSFDWWAVETAGSQPPAINNQPSTASQTSTVMNTALQSPVNATITTKATVTTTTISSVAIIDGTSASSTIATTTLSGTSISSATDSVSASTTVTDAATSVNTASTTSP